MNVTAKPWFWRVLAGALFLLPAVLVANALSMLDELEQARHAFLRNTAAAVAARLEQEPESAVAAAEPAVTTLATFGPADAAAPPAARAIFAGQRLFSVEPGATAFRAFVPYHAESGLRVARVDLNPASGDFLTARPRRNLYLAILVTLAMATLSAYALWARQRQARLLRLAELGQMSAVLAHEIRNPLGALKGFLQLALERSSGDARSWLETSLEQTGRLERLVRDLLLYARVPTPDLQPVHWRDVEARLRPHVPHARFEAADFTFLSDAAMLEQILLNLLRNAAEAAPDVLVQAQPGLIRVTDNGAGLPADIRRRLFQPFSTTKAQGTGLGLAIARNLAHALGAELTLGDAQPAGTCAQLRWRT